MSSMVVMRNIPVSPMSMRVFLPARSIMISEMTVIATFMAPMPSVADWLAASSKPAVPKILVEKKMAALMPESCWASIIMMAMMRGWRRELLVSISFRVTLGTSFMDSCSCFISSISSWISIVPRSQVRATIRNITVIVKYYNGQVRATIIW